MSERWSHEILITRESGAGPVRVRCLMRRSRFPDAGLPSGRLLYLTTKRQIGRCFQLGWSLLSIAKLPKSHATLALA
jgi:hypothetical protein